MPTTVTLFTIPRIYINTRWKINQINVIKFILKAICDSSISYLISDDVNSGSAVEDFDKWTTFRITLNAVHVLVTLAF